MCGRMLCLLLLLLTCLVCGNEGIRLSLEPYTKETATGQTTCGILTCQEISEPLHLSNISSMSVYKHWTTSGPMNSNTIISLSRKHPDIDLVAQGVKVFGSLTDKISYASLTLTDPRDCLEAEFLCKVEYYDAAGKAWVISSRLQRTKEEIRPFFNTSGGYNKAAYLSQTLGTFTDKMKTNVNIKYDDKMDRIIDILEKFESKFVKIERSLEEQSKNSKDACNIVSTNARNNTRDKDEIKTSQGVIDNIEPVDKTSTVVNTIFDQIKNEHAICDCGGNNSKAKVETDKQKHLRCEKNQENPVNKYYIVSSTDGLPKYLCDGMTDGGGWIVIQRRNSSEVNFYRNWDDYKNGFGSFDTNFWLGNDLVHNLTDVYTYELNVTLKYKNKTYYAYYDNFHIDNEDNRYKLTVSGYSGTAGDSLSYHSGRKFSTFDQDNDVYSSNCAVNSQGAWWYYACHRSNLNGKWKSRGDKSPRWYALTTDESVDFSEMKIRRV